MNSTPVGAQALVCPVSELSAARTSPKADQQLSFRIAPWSDALCSQWRDLERRVADVPLAASSHWTAAWVHQFGDAVDVRVAVAESAGRVCGLALMPRSRTQRVGPFRLRTTHLGTAGEVSSDSVCVEYNALLVESDYRAAFAASLVALARRDSVDEVRLDGFDEESVQHLFEGLPGVDIALRASRYFDLDSARARGASVMDTLGGSTRSSLRRALKKTGPIEVTQAASLDEADDILSELVELHQARWRSAGQPGAFASPRFSAFQRELVTRLLPEERVVLLRVRSQPLTVGCLMLLVDRGRLLDYLSGFASFEATPSPGIVTHYLAMERALAHGYRAYDFLVGDKRHKSNLATDSRDLVWGVWRKPSWKNRALAGLRAFKRRIAKTPALNEVEA
jgi:CelD/BcsL family acetyltransferase involved in cellulose biosynthesis